MVQAPDPCPFLPSLLSLPCPVASQAYVAIASLKCILSLLGIVKERPSNGNSQAKPVKKSSAATASKRPAKLKGDLAEAGAQNRPIPTGLVLSHLPNTKAMRL